MTVPPSRSPTDQVATLTATVDQLQAEVNLLQTVTLLVVVGALGTLILVGFLIHGTFDTPSS